MNKALIVILSTVTLDAVGIGLIFPILPAPAARGDPHGRGVDRCIGLMLALYAAMQFLFSPVLGVLSDRFGRRPVLLVSLAGAAIDYLIMAFAPNSGCWSSAAPLRASPAPTWRSRRPTSPTSRAEDQRAKRFGYFHAMFGIGFIIGPVLGGVLGDIWVRAPFIAAALLNGLNFALALFVLPESRTGAAWRRVQASASSTRSGPLGWALTFKALLPMMAIFLIMNFVGTMYGTVWVLFSEDAFRWSASMIGLRFGAFGVCHAGAQALLTGPVARLVGEQWALIIGIFGRGDGLAVIGFATQGWIMFARRAAIWRGRYRHAGAAVADHRAGRCRQSGASCRACSPAWSASRPYSGHCSFRPSISR